MSGRPTKPRVDDNQLNNARRMRQAPTDAERRLWLMLRDRRLGGFKFRRQATAGPYILDFFCDECGLAVEADGGQHTRRDNVARDAERTEYLRMHGIEVARYSNIDVLKNSEGLRADIHAKLLARRAQLGVRPRPSPLPEGEGAGAAGLVRRQSLNILLTAGPTREPIDPVRFLGNRSSGKVGLAIAAAAVTAGHSLTLIAGPIPSATPTGCRRIDVESSADMRAAVLREFPSHDALIMAAAVADYRPKRVSAEKLGRQGKLMLELEPTEDIVAAASAIKRADQRTVGFSLEQAGEAGIARAAEKMRRKQLDLMVYNPLNTMGADMIDATLLYADGTSLPLGSRSKADFADTLLQRVAALFPR